MTDRVGYDSATNNNRHYNREKSYETNRSTITTSSKARHYDSTSSRARNYESNTSAPVMHEPSQDSIGSSQSQPWQQDLREMQKVSNSLEKGEQLDFRPVPELLSSLIEQHNDMSTPGSTATPNMKEAFAKMNTINLVMRAVQVSVARSEGRDVFWPWVKKELHDAAGRQSRDSNQPPSRLLAIAAIFNKMVTSEERTRLRQYAPELFPLLEYAMKPSTNGRVLTILVNALVRLAEEAQSEFLKYFQTIADVLVEVALDIQGQSDPNIRAAMISTLGRFGSAWQACEQATVFRFLEKRINAMFELRGQMNKVSCEKFCGLFDIVKNIVRCIPTYLASTGGTEFVQRLLDVCSPTEGAAAMFPPQRVLAAEVVFLLCQKATDSDTPPAALPVHAMLMDWLTEVIFAPECMSCWAVPHAMLGGTKFPDKAVMDRFAQIVGSFGALEKVLDVVDGTPQAVFYERDDRVLLAILSSRKDIIAKLDANVPDATLAPTVDYLRVIVKRNPDIIEDVVELADLAAAFRALADHGDTANKLLDAWVDAASPGDLVSCVWRAVAAMADRYQVLEDMKADILKTLHGQGSPTAVERAKEFVEAVRDAPAPLWSLSQGFSSSILLFIRIRHRRSGTSCTATDDAILALAKSALESGPTASSLFLKMLGPWMLLTESPAQARLLFEMKNRLPQFLSTCEVPGIPIGLEIFCTTEFSARKALEIAAKGDSAPDESMKDVLRHMMSLSSTAPLAKLAPGPATAAQQRSNGLPASRGSLELTERQREAAGGPALAADQTVGMDLVHGCYRMACTIIGTRLKSPLGDAGRTLQALENSIGGAALNASARVALFLKGGSASLSTAAPLLTLMLLHQLQAAALQALDQDSNLPALGKSCASFFEQNQKVWTDWLGRSADFAVLATMRFAGAGALLQICGQNLSNAFDRIGYSFPIRPWETYHLGSSRPGASQFINAELFIIRMILASVRLKSAANVRGALRLWKRCLALADLPGTSSAPMTPQQTPSQTPSVRSGMSPLPGVEKPNGAHSNGVCSAVMYVFDDDVTSDLDPLLQCSGAFIAAAEERVEDCCKAFEAVIGNLPKLTAATPDHSIMRAIHAAVARVWLDAAAASCLPDLLDFWSSQFKNSPAASGAAQKWACALSAKFRGERAQCQSHMQSVLNRVVADWPSPNKAGAPLPADMIDGCCRLSRWDDLATIFAMDARVEQKNGSARFKGAIRMSRSIVSAACAGQKVCAPTIMPPDEVDVPFKLLPALDFLENVSGKEGTSGGDVAVDPDIVQKLQLPPTKKLTDRFKYIQKLVGQKNILLARSLFDKLKERKDASAYSSHWHITAGMLTGAEKKQALAFSLIHKHAMMLLESRVRMPMFKKSTSVVSDVPSSLLNLSWNEDREREIADSPELATVLSSYLKMVVSKAPQLHAAQGTADLAAADCASMSQCLVQFADEFGKCLNAHGLTSLKNAKSPPLSRAGDRFPRPFEPNGLSAAFTGLLLQQNVVMFPSRAKSWTLYGDWWYSQRAVFGDDELLEQLPADVQDTLPWSWTTIRQAVEAIGGSNDELLHDTPLASMPSHNTGFNLQTSSFEMSPGSKSSEMATENKPLHPCLRLVVDCLRVVVRMWSRKGEVEYPTDEWIEENCPKLSAVIKAFPNQPIIKEGIMSAIQALCDKAEQWKTIINKEAFEAYTIYLQRSGTRQLSSIAETDPHVLKVLTRLLKLLPHVSDYPDSYERMLEGPVALWEPMVMQLVSLMRHPHPATANLALEVYKRLSRKVDPVFTIYPALATQPPAGVIANKNKTDDISYLNKSWHSLALPALTKFLEKEFPKEVASAKQFIHLMNEVASPIDELMYRYLEHMQSALISERSLVDPSGVVHVVVTKIKDLVESIEQLSGDKSSKNGGKAEIRGVLELMTADHGPPNVDSEPAKEFLERMMPLLKDFVREQEDIQPTDALGGQPKEQKDRLQQCLQRVRALIKECSSANRVGKVAVESIAPQLANFVKENNPKLPVRMSSTDSQPLMLSSAHSSVGVIFTKTRPKKLTFKSADGSVVSFLLKGRDDLHLDAVLMQLYEATTAVIQSAPPVSPNVLRCRSYDVIPLAPRCGLLRWVPGAPLFSQYKSRRQRKVKDDSSTGTRKNPDTAAEAWSKTAKKRLQENGIDPKKVSRKHWPAHILKDVFAEMRNKHGVPDLISRLLFKSALHPQHAFQMNQRYAESCAVASAAGHLIGLGDRHLDNLLIDTDNGEVVHVDFTVCFDRGKRLRVPEKIPFRLTPCIEHALGPFGTEGVFKTVCSTVLSCVREHREIFTGLVQTLSLMPLTEWVQPNTAPFVGTSDASLDKIESACNGLVAFQEGIVEGPALKGILDSVKEFDEQWRTLSKVKEMVDKPEVYKQRQREHAWQVQEVESKRPPIQQRAAILENEMDMSIHKALQTISHDLVPSLPRLRNCAQLLCLPLGSPDWIDTVKSLEGQRAKRVLATGRPWQFPLDAPGVSPGIFTQLGEILADGMASWDALRTALTHIKGCESGIVAQAIMNNAPTVNMLTRFQACGLVKRRHDDPFLFEMSRQPLHLQNLDAVQKYFPWFSKDGQVKFVELFEEEMAKSSDVGEWQHLAKSGALRPRELTETSSEASIRCKTERKAYLEQAGLPHARSRDHAVVQLTSMCLTECAELLEVLKRADSPRWPAENASSYLQGGLVADTVAQEDAILFFFGVVGQFKELVEVTCALEVQPNMQDYRSALEAVDRLCGALVAIEMGLCGITAEGTAGPAVSGGNVVIHSAGLNDEKYCLTLEDFFASLVTFRSSGSHPCATVENVQPAVFPDGRPPEAPKGSNCEAQIKIEKFITELEEHIHMLSEVLKMEGGPFSVKAASAFVSEWQRILKEIDGGQQHIAALASAHNHIWQALETLRHLKFPEAPLTRKMNAWGAGGRADDWHYIRSRLSDGLKMEASMNIEDNGNFIYSSASTCASGNGSMWHNYAEAMLLLAEAKAAKAAFGNGPPTSSAGSELLSMVQSILLPWLVPAVSNMWLLLIRTLRTQEDVSIATSSCEPVALAHSLTMDVRINDGVISAMRMQCTRQRQYLWLKRNLALGQGVQRMIPVVTRIRENMTKLNRWVGVATVLGAESLLSNLERGQNDGMESYDVPSLKFIRENISGNRLRSLFSDVEPFALLKTLLQKHAAIGSGLRAAYDEATTNPRPADMELYQTAHEMHELLGDAASMFLGPHIIPSSKEIGPNLGFLTIATTNVVDELSGLRAQRRKLEDDLRRCQENMIPPNMVSVSSIRQLTSGCTNKIRRIARAVSELLRSHSGFIQCAGRLRTLGTVDKPSGIAAMLAPAAQDLLLPFIELRLGLAKYDQTSQELQRRMDAVEKDYSLISWVSRRISPTLLEAPSNIELLVEHAQKVIAKEQEIMTSNPAAIAALKLIQNEQAIELPDADWPTLLGGAKRDATDLTERSNAGSQDGAEEGGLAQTGDEDGEDGIPEEEEDDKQDGEAGEDREEDGEATEGVCHPWRKQASAAVRCLSRKIPSGEKGAAASMAASLIAQAKDETNLATM